MLTQTAYIEYLLSTPTNYTCTHLAAHLPDMSRDQVNRFFAQQSTDGQIVVRVSAAVVARFARGVSVSG